MVDNAKGRSIATVYVSLALVSQGLQATIKKEVGSAIKGAGADDALKDGLQKGGKEGGKEASKGVNKSLTDGFKKLGKPLGRALNKGLDGAAKTMKVGVGAVGAGLAAGIGTALAAGFKRMSDIENARKSIEGLGYDMKTVDAVSNDALAAVKGTAYGLGDAYKAASRGLGAGLEQGAELEKYLTSIADASAIANSSFDEMSGIMGKIAATGKVTGETLNQLEERGFGAGAALAEYFGVTQEEVRGMISAGEVSINDFLGMMEMYEGAALKSGETTAGALSLLMSSFGRLGEVMLGDSFGLVKSFANEMTTAVDGLAEAIKPAFQQINEDISNELGGGLEGSGQRFADFLMANQDAITEYLVGGYETFKKTVSDIFAYLSEADIDPAAALGQGFSILQGFTTSLNEALQAAIPILDLIGETGIMTLMSFVVVLTEVLNLLLPILQTFNDLYTSLDSDGQTLVAQLIAGAIVFGWVIRLIGPIIGGIFSALKGIVGWFRKGGKEASGFRNAWTTISNAVKGVWGWLQRMWGQIRNIGGAIGKFMRTPLVGITGILTLIAGILGAVSAAAFIMIGLTEGWENALSGVGEFWVWMLGGMEYALEGFMMLLKDIWDWIKIIVQSGGTFMGAVGRWAGGGAQTASVPAMATGGDVMGPTLLLAGEKDPETIVNRGVMNTMMAEVTADLRARNGTGGTGNPQQVISISVHPSEGMDERQLADKVYRRLEWEGRF